MTDQLQLYNLTAYALQETKLDDLTEERNLRFVLDDIYPGVISFCLEQGYWNFGMRTVQAEASNSIEPGVWYQYAFEKPADWVKTYILSSSPDLRGMPQDIVDEAGFWYANFNPLFAKFVSSDPSYGGNLLLWPASFEHYVAQRLAVIGCKAIKGTEPSDLLLKAEITARVDAKAKDALNEPPKFQQTNSWVNSRFRGRGYSQRGEF